jgi:hypothetical protein
MNKMLEMVGRLWGMDLEVVQVVDMNDQFKNNRLVVGNRFPRYKTCLCASIMLVELKVVVLQWHPMAVLFEVVVIQQLSFQPRLSSCPQPQDRLS